MALAIARRMHLSQSRAAAAAMTDPDPTVPRHSLAKLTRAAEADPICRDHEQG
ncbi:hypothetical protein [Bradyrhizobium sp. ORS 285]|uniref:hypothetical protein n=1 Tax=Bradyrhizobium sp. ORS 285 TaxID=115808 RepID=UPI0002DD1632|nr:hypothetical protein [Bradyrhizobium sp. ORS 285]